MKALTYKTDDQYPQQCLDKVPVVLRSYIPYREKVCVYIGICHRFGKLTGTLMALTEEQRALLWYTFEPCTKCSIHIMYMRQGLQKTTASNDMSRQHIGTGRLMSIVLVSGQES